MKLGALVTRLCCLAAGIVGIVSGLLLCLLAAFAATVAHWFFDVRGALVMGVLRALGIGLGLLMAKSAFIKSDSASVAARGDES